MAQTEDTELRDLVIDALEKNGSLAKIRALLRANIFLAFDDERDNLKQNPNLDSIFKLPEGVLSLSIIHEFLEFCNLKNTLFVYVSESRQNKEYKYEGRKGLMDKINLINQDLKEPILITLIKTLLKYQHSPETRQNIKCVEKNCDNNLKDEQNCTYIVHEDSQTSNTNSNSDNSSDEKNKLQLRLQLDNSDTDTSSDSARDKSGSEYILNNFLPSKNETALQYSKEQEVENKGQNDQQESNKSKLIQENFINTISSDSTSYVDIKSFNITNNLLTASPIHEDIDEKLHKSTSLAVVQNSGIELDKSPTLSNKSSLSQKNANKEISDSSKSNTGSGKSDLESAEYSYDFSSSPKKKETLEQYTKTSNSQGDIAQSSKKINVQEDQNHSPDTSQSSISISDVADLISERSSSIQTRNGKRGSNNESNLSLKKAGNLNKIQNLSDNSGELTESPIPSLSNLSLDIHSD